MSPLVTVLGRFNDHHSRSELGSAQLRAAEAYGVPRASFVVHGSTGANAVALRAALMRRGSLRVLVAGGGHHSILNEIMALSGTVRFLATGIDRRFEAWLPPTPDALDRALTDGPPVDLVVFTSPTYEGLPARIGELAEVAHRYDALVHVDGAWSSLNGFHPALPSSPVAAGADSASISVHKLSGALSQAALLTWSPEHLGEHAVPLALAQYATTSPNYLIAASMDQALIDLSRQGEAAITRAIGLRAELRSQLERALPALEWLQPDAGRFTDHDHNFGVDPMRLTIGLAGYKASGFATAALLRRHGVVAEKAGLQTLTVFVPLGASDDLPIRVAATVDEVLGGLRRDAEEPRAPLPPDALPALPLTPVEPPADALRRALCDGHFVPIESAAGRICGELVEVYPPGIPVGVPGFRITDAAVRYLTTVAGAGGHIVSLAPDRLLVLD